jgi:hypothetical protein
MTTNLPRYGTLTRLLFDLVCVRPGATTHELVVSTGGRLVSGNTSYINSCLNSIRRRGLIENRSRTKAMGRWHLTVVGLERADEAGIQFTGSQHATMLDPGVGVGS